MGTMNQKKRRSQQGFTLTELIVAMAIFLVLGAGMTSLFSAAVHSVREAYASIDAFEQGRTATTTMTRDLTGAFASREHGDVYNFYGRHDGFMFVGALDGGNLGRVTYVFHPEAAKRPYITKIKERWGIYTDSVRRQAERIAREYGYFGLAVQNAGQQAVNDLVAAYGAHGDNDIIELDVALETESLIRYEEPGVSSLDYFDMQVTGPASPVNINLEWPYVDALDDARDAVFPDETDPEIQQDFLLSAINPSPDFTNYDLRNMLFDINQIDGGWTHPITLDTLYLRVLGRSSIDAMLQARKREFWIRMLSGESMGLASLAGGYWYDEGTGLPNDNFKRIVNEYVVADGIISRAIILVPDTETPLFTFVGAEPLRPIPDTAMDALDADVRFAYSDGQNNFVNYFNALENLADPDDPYLNGPNTSGPDLYSLVRNGTGIIEKGPLIRADNALADSLLGTRDSRKNMGSILTPRIPAVVTPQLWVTRSKRRAGGADIRRLFTQSIQIPAATGRTAPTAVAVGPGGAL